ncbi:MAG: hypothetical protein Q8L84_07790, partial [Hyphomonas sp.]|nr:hypothetical protein [Hyphomonas sp.]
YFGRSDAAPVLNPEEVQAVKWMSLEALAENIAAAPEQYAAWLRHYIEAHPAELATWRDRI